MRYAFAAALLVATALPATARDRPTGNCSADFVARWQADKIAVVESNQTPRKPCWMQTDTGRYVCDRDGCSRESAYFSNE